jgi:hypothetical protein
MAVIKEKSNKRAKAEDHRPQFRRQRGCDSRGRHMHIRLARCRVAAIAAVLLAHGAAVTVSSELSPRKCRPNRTPRKKKKEQKKTNKTNFNSINDF